MGPAPFCRYGVRQTSREAGGGQTATLQLDLHLNCVIKTDLENKTDDKTEICNGMGHLFTARIDKKRNIKNHQTTTKLFSILLGVWSQ